MRYYRIIKEQKYNFFLKPLNIRGFRYKNYRFR